jgi:hypothetical protein
LTKPPLAVAGLGSQRNLGFGGAAHLHDRSLDRSRADAEVVGLVFAVDN